MIVVVVVVVNAHVVVVRRGGRGGSGHDFQRTKSTPTVLCWVQSRNEQYTTPAGTAQHSKGVLSLSFCRLDDNSLEQDRTAPRLVVQQASYSIPFCKCPSCLSLSPRKRDIKVFLVFLAPRRGTDFCWPVGGLVEVPEEPEDNVPASRKLHTRQSSCCTVSLVASFDPSIGRHGRSKKL